MKTILLVASLATAQALPPKCYLVRHVSIVWRHYGFVSYPWYQIGYTQVCR